MVGNDPRRSPSRLPAEGRVLPMELHIGDRLVDETGEWEVIVKVKTLYVGLDAWKMA